MKFYELKVQLKNISKPPVWRKIRVDAEMTMEDLHQIVQRAMEWEGYHLHHFIIGDPRRRALYVTAKEEMERGFGFMEDQMDEKEVIIGNFLQNIKDKIVYEYDFGDGWEHVISLEKIVEGNEATLTPFLISAKGACPPEDCGGAWGYENLKEIMANPKDNKEEYKDMSDWLGVKKWDAKEVDVDDINLSLKEIKGNFGVSAKRERLLNLSSIPSSKWNKKQQDVAQQQFGEVVDLAFPKIDPSWSEDEVMERVIELVEEMLEIRPTAIHVMGDMHATFLFVIMCAQFQIPCYISTFERTVKMTKAGKKEITLDFVRFRKYIMDENPDNLF
jgi:hypothetical protein